MLEEFRHQQSDETYHDLSSELISRGYTENEINFAFSWVFNHLQGKNMTSTEQFEYSANSNRVLHDVERLVISPEAYKKDLPTEEGGLEYYYFDPIAMITPLMKAIKELNEKIEVLESK